jgi:N-acetyl-D-muramate 6-phosphate phosphatase
MKRRAHAVLFDLDGTLVDSAPDLAAAVNRLRTERQLPEVPYERLRPMVGSGARGMIGAAFGIAPGHEEFELLRDAFLAHYEGGLLQRTAVFPAVAGLLDELDGAGLPWGIVTNKAERFAGPVVHGVGLGERTGALVCGDTTPHAKPHPEPLLEAARRLGVPAASCIYVGDDLRDVQAGRAAGMATVAVTWGYLGESVPVAEWGADLVIDEPLQLLKWLQMD